MTNMIYTAMPSLPKKHHTNAVVLPSEWNTCPLSSIVEEISETVGTRKIETISISAGIGFVNQAEKFGRELSGKQYEKYIVLHKGDFSYNKGNSNIYPQGCIYRLNNRTEAAVPNVFESFRVSVGNPDYYEQLFLSGFLNRQLYSKINRGVRDNGLLNLKGKDFYSCEVPYPPLAEQERIAEILIQCDRVIELKEQKLDELKQLKKEFLRKMFPAKGCDTPEIRFPGFTGAWEQRKLGTVTELLTGFPFESKKFTNDGIKLVRGTNVKRGYLDFSEGLCEYWTSAQGLENYLLKSGDILIQMDGALIGKSYAKIRENQLPALLVQRVTRARVQSNNADEAFVYQQIQKGFLAYIKGTKTETAVPHLSLSDIENFMIEIPSIGEQKQIGAFFEQLDTLITLHQRELEETKTYKKTLAKLLLTGIVRVQG